MVLGGWVVVFFLKIGYIEVFFLRFELVFCLF